MKILALALLSTVLTLRAETDNVTMIGDSHPGEFYRLPYFCTNLTVSANDIPGVQTGVMQRITAKSAAGLYAVADGYRERLARMQSFDTFVDRYGNEIMPIGLTKYTNVVDHSDMTHRLNRKIMNEAKHAYNWMTNVVTTTRDNRGMYGTSLNENHRDMYKVEFEGQEREQAAKKCRDAVLNGLYSSYYDYSFFGDTNKYYSGFPWYYNAAVGLSGYYTVENKRESCGYGDVSNIVNEVLGRTDNFFVYTNDTERITAENTAKTAAMIAATDLSYHSFGNPLFAFTNTTLYVTNDLYLTYTALLKVKEIIYGAPFDPDTTNYTYVVFEIEKDEYGEPKESYDLHDFNNVVILEGLSRAELPTYSQDPLTEGISIRFDQCIGIASVTNMYDYNYWPNDMFHSGCYIAKITPVINYRANTMELTFDIRNKDTFEREAYNIEYFDQAPIPVDLENIKGTMDIKVKCSSAEVSINRLAYDNFLTPGSSVENKGNFPFWTPSKSNSNFVDKVHLQLCKSITPSWESEEISASFKTLDDHEDIDMFAYKYVEGIVTNCIHMVKERVDAYEDFENDPKTAAKEYFRRCCLDKVDEIRNKLLDKDGVPVRVSHYNPDFYIAFYNNPYYKYLLFYDPNLTQVVPKSKWGDYLTFGIVLSSVQSADLEKGASVNAYWDFSRAIKWKDFKNLPLIHRTDDTNQDN